MEDKKEVKERIIDNNVRKDKGSSQAALELEALESVRHIYLLPLTTGQIYHELTRHAIMKKGFDMTHFSPIKQVFLLTTHHGDLSRSGVYLLRDVAICRPTYCPNPECDIQRGERLRIPANQCCPECISSSQGSCQYEGVIYAHDSQWSPSPCTACVCPEVVVLHPSPLLSSQLSLGPEPVHPAGECCPKWPQ
ncbi:hypothetical protein F7725_013231 [Dissostichus mawsoni]|uniref:VWFC domain-containing protein n=1 Tax=Dissostichus mawsoni TaxID=36200 RepID=A0A7J5YRY8_DISMA|nr:hypothetical protein F7725_013231 [Dissostichus mawsoni]